MFLVERFMGLVPVFAVVRTLHVNKEVRIGVIAMGVGGEDDAVLEDVLGVISGDDDGWWRFSCF